MFGMMVFIGLLTLVIVPFLTIIFIVPKLKDKNHRILIHIMLCCRVV